MEEPAPLSVTWGDAQVSYEVTAWKSTFRLGGSNLLHNVHREAYGAPMIGTMGYLSWTLDLKRTRS